MKSRLHFACVAVLTLLVSSAADPARGQSPLGNAMSFNGTNQYVSVGNFGNIMPTTEVTVEFWADTAKFAGQSAFQLAPDDGNNRFNVHLNYGNSYTSALTYWDFGNIITGGRLDASCPPNSISNWVHYAMVASQSGNYMRIYTNGVLQASQTGMTPFTRGNYSLQIGGPNFPYAGSLDEFRVWSVARSQAQIQATMNTPLTGFESGLVVYYRFDNTNGSFVPNLAFATAPGYNGVAANSPAWVPSGAGVLTVTTNADSGLGSLRDTVAGAFPGATIAFAPALSGQVITLTNGEITLSNNITIDGSALAGGIQINGNHADRIFYVAGGVTVLNSLTITNGFYNGISPGSFGGGIENLGNLTLNRCTIAGNSAGPSFGGGLENNLSGGSLAINECTFAGNSAAGGGAIASAGPFTLNQSTISGNTCGSGHGAGINAPNGMTLSNSIVAGNTSGGSPEDISGSVLPQSSFNLVGSANGLADGVNGNHVGITMPALAPLGNYGGPTPTMPPLPGSPAIDGCTNGAIFATDQRGFPRVVGAWADIGATESGNPVPGVDYTVVSTTNDFLNGLANDGISLRDAVAFATNDAMITFAPSLSGRSIVLGGTPILLDRNLAIDGSALPGGVQINGNAQSFIFLVTNNVSVVMNSLTLTNGNDAGGAYAGGLVNLGTLTMNNCALVGNAEHGGAGGAWNEFSGQMTLNNCTVAGNVANSAASVDNDGVLTVINCTISGNRATNDVGGIRNFNTLNLTNSIVCDNVALSNPNLLTNIAFKAASNLVDTNALLAPLGNYGGPTPTMPPLLNSPAIDAGSDSAASALATDQRGYPRKFGPHVDIGAVELNLGSVVQTDADSGFGSLRYVYAYTTNSAITFAASLAGSTISLTSGELRLNRNVAIDAGMLPGGIAIDGGGNRIFEVPAAHTVVLNALTLENASAPGGSYPANSGGGILNYGVLSISNCVFSQNDAITAADSGGGAIENFQGAVTISSSTLNGNVSSLVGGAIESYQGVLTLDQDTLTANDVYDSDGTGGAIYCDLTTLSVMQSTITGNYADVAGGVFTGGTATIFNSIVAGNGALAETNLSGTYTSAGVNLTAGDPMLAPLDLWGGPTRTMPPLPGSPAIDAAAATAFATDQRGLPRVVGGGPDIGSVEFGIQPIVVSLYGTSRPGNGRFQIGLTNLSGISFTAYGTTNLNLPFNAWSNLGPVLESPPFSGQYKFTDLNSDKIPLRFYRVQSP
jgi:hypothetical protein